MLASIHGAKPLEYFKGLIQAKMKILNPYCALKVILFLMIGVLTFGGCDSGEKVIDKATGNQDVKQFQQMKKDIGKIADQQAERYNQIPDDKNN